MSRSSKIFKFSTARASFLCFSRDRFSVFELRQVFIFEKIERRNVLVRSFGLDRVLACSVVREKAGESLFCSIFVFLCLVVSIFLRLNVSFVGFCVAILSEQPRASLFTCALGL